MSTYADSSDFTPTVIRGESLHEVPRGEFLVDTFSVTFPVSSMERVTGDVSPWVVSDDDISDRMQAFVNHLFGAGIFTVSDKVSGGRNFFESAITFDGKAFIAWGGNNKVRDYDGGVSRLVEERAQLYMTGEACAMIKNWDALPSRLADLGARLTRVDLAFDDHDGIHNVDLCREKFLSGEFKGQGRPPKASYIDDFGSGDGRTFYVGRRENGKLLRCYDKGKQLGDPNSPWVRWECELHNRDRELPLDMLTNPAEYLAGAYPALSFLSKVAHVIRTAREKVSIQYDKLRRIARTQYGKLINFAHQVMGLRPDQIFYEFCNPKGFPDRLVWSGSPGVIANDVGGFESLRAETQTHNGQLMKSVLNDLATIEV